MKEFLTNILGYAIGFGTLVLMILFIPVSLEPAYIYEDLDGNINYARSCSYSDKSLISGGQGTPICIDGKKVTQVKWYSNNDREYKSLFFRLKEI